MKLRAKLTDLRASMGEVTVELKTTTSPEEIEKYKDKDIDVEIKQHRNHRSLDANACLWACISDLAGAVGVTNWDMYLMELSRYGQFVNVKVRAEAYEDLQAHWRETVVVGDEKVTEQTINRVTGYPEEAEVTYLYVNCYYGSHEYNTKDFSRLLSGVIDDMKGQGLDTPPSEDMKRMLYEMEQREKAKEAK